MCIPLHCEFQYTSQIIYNVKHGLGISDYRYIRVVLFRDKALFYIHLPKISQVFAPFQSRAEFKQVVTVPLKTKIF
jgi:hypothetical protein